LSEFLDAVAAAAKSERGPILECGSGLTTLILAVAAERSRAEVWSLENDPEWYLRVQSVLREFGLQVLLRRVPLRSYGEFDWYDVEGLELPVFSVVVCDGPPGETRGGRYGLLPVLQERLATGCTVLVDDAARPSEQAMLERWKSEGFVRYELRGTEKPYGLATILGSAGATNPREQPAG
jgi:predicted O-methyltransferase YrrM